MLLQDPSGLVDTTPMGSQEPPGRAASQLQVHQHLLSTECQPSADLLQRSTLGRIC